MLVGVGAASSDAPANELMVHAVEAAIGDAGSRSLRRAIDRIAVPQGTWTDPDPGRTVASVVGSPDATTHLAELGIPQQALISDALRAIQIGESEVAVVVGGEAKRWERDHPAGSNPSEQAGGVPDVTHRRPGPLVEDIEVVHRLWEPVLQYALIENATRTDDASTLEDHRQAIAALWSRFNEVAGANDRAAFPERMDADAIAAASPSNRPLAFPYNKWHATQWTVNQAAALVVCSVEAAHHHRVSTDRWIFPLVGLESSHAVSLLRRKEPHRWPAMAALGAAASRRIGRNIAELDVLELYSCFPSAVRVQQRELGLGGGSTPTITGGMTFAGGPFNNFVLQAMVDVAEAVRGRTQVMGGVTTVSGLLTKPAIGVWASEPDGEPPLIADLAALSRTSTETVQVVPTLDGYSGDGSVATYTVTYDGWDPSRTITLCALPDGRRCVAVSDDAELARHATRSELCGERVRIGQGGFEPS